MDFPTLLGIALALAMDAFAVSVSVGIGLRKVSFRQTFRLSWHFGLFQALMPVIGWYLGRTVHTLIEAFDHWVAFGLLFYIGLSMIRHAFSKEDDHDFKKADPTKGYSMVFLSVATSIDALAVGISLSMLKISVVFPSLIIGIVALILTILGLHLGSRAASVSRFGKLAEIIGGSVLWIIGFNILYENGVLEQIKEMI
jgi:manganese efflux pump family protein